MLASGIKSRPLYTGISLNPKATQQLFVVEGVAVSRVAELLPVANLSPSEAARIAVLWFGDGEAAKLSGLSCTHMPSEATLMVRLDSLLGQAQMGLCLSVIGSEAFIGRVVQLAQNHGMDFDSLQTEQANSLARRVQCVHCKGMMERVTTSIVTCPHCQLPLFVRDHYSRRLGAFQGVCANAEDGIVPPVEVLYP
ncbi:MAG: dimethylamine monooxygenase subunit DmmA family protein [Alphaproteobacteria bacterium]|nr:dimethylamine monooxygenase subunit DmmA family protein [Alphaproteobacteria bacterium]